MNILYSTNNNTCYNDSNGFIIIESISFTEAEEDLYSTYTIEWTGDFTNSTISNDKFNATLLKNGTYTFRVVSTSSTAQSDIYTVNITSPNELLLSNVKYTRYACSGSGSLYVEISGGIAPYSCSLGPYNIVSSDNFVEFKDIDSGDYSLSVTDANDCSYTWANTISIDSADVSYSIENVVPPKLLDSFVTIRFLVNGQGPFSFAFDSNDNDDNSIFIDTYETKYLESSEDNVYQYTFNDILVPGSYQLTIKNTYGCNITQDIILPNASPMIVGLSILSDISTNNVFVADTTLPIFDTILIPYKLIINNSPLWNIIKDKQSKDNLELYINDTKYTYNIYKILLNKYCINDDQIQILRLDNDSDNWYYYFYIAPGINLNTNPELLAASIQLKYNDQVFDITFGLSNGDIDHENASLICGSFLLPDLGYDQFFNGGNIDVSIGEPSSVDDTNFIVKNIKRSTTANTYSIGYVTILNFLEYFNVLNSQVYINQTACNITPDEYQYIINIKELLKAINNFDNVNNVYIFNKSYYEGSNSTLSLNIIGNDLLTNIDDTLIVNSYNVQYFAIRDNYNDLLQVYLGSQKAENILSLSGLKNGYYIIRIKDSYNNIPRSIRYDSYTINYDEHFLLGKKIIQNFNEFLVDKFIYGDILIYMGEDQEIIDNTLIPSQPQPINLTPTLPAQTIDIIQQTKDEANKTSLIVNTTQNIIHYIYGPNNYKHEFTNSIQLTNMVPGVYTIIGNIDNLISNSLYQNETRINVEKNNSYEIYINFISYANSIFIKEN